MNIFQFNSIQSVPAVTPTAVTLAAVPAAVTKHRLGHDLVRLVDKSAPDSRTASYTRADVWVETITETN